MTEMLTRQVQDNRLIRAAPTFETTLGQTVGASFAAAGRQTLGTLALGELSQPDEFAGFTDIQGYQVRIGDVMRGRELTELQSDLHSESDPVRRVEMINRVNELKGGREAQIDAYTREAVDAGRMQSKDALAEMYGDLGLTFDRAMTQEDADLLAQDKREEIIRQAIIEAGPKGIIPGAARFGAGLAAMAVDPLEVATMFIPVVGVAGRAASVSRFGRVGGRTVVGATEGLVGSALTEPFIYTMSRSQQLDYTMTDALMNVGLGAVLGGGLGTVIGAFSKRVSRVDTPLEAFDRAVRETQAIIASDWSIRQNLAASTSIRQFATGQSVNVSGIIRGMQEQVDAIAKTATATRKQPLIEALKGSVQIHPDGRAAAELKQAGVTPQSSPGLFSRQGHKDLDNLVAVELEDAVPGITQKAGVEGDYLRPQGLIDAIVDEVNIGARSGLEADMARAEGELERIKSIAEQVEESGFILRDESELFFLDDRMQEGLDLEDALDQLVKYDPADTPADLARNASDPHLDPLANFDASARADMEVPDQFTDEAIAEMEAAVNALDESGTLSAEARADLDAIKDVNQYSKTYADASRAIATCMVGV